MTKQKITVRGKARHAVLAAISALALLLGAPSGGTAPAMADGRVKTITSSSASQKIKLGLNKSIVVDLPSDAYDILVANPTIADAVTRTARRIYLFGKQVGETNVFVFGSNGEQIVSFDLHVERDVAGLQDYLQRFIPESDIKVEVINDNIVLTGTVQTPQDAQRASKLAEIFVTGGEATTGQFTTTAAPTGGGTGSVAIDNPDSQRRTSQIVNLLKIIGEDQVTLKVTVAEVQRSVMKQLGVNLLASTAADGITYSAVSDTFAGLGKALSSTGGSIVGSIGSTTINAYLNAMEESGVMRTLAEPSLTAVSGQKAEFKVGGEFNVLNSVSNDGTTNTYGFDKVEYGIGLEFLPVVLSAGRISLKIRTAVSEPTSQGSASISGGPRLGANILSIRKRLADTTVELPSGGSLMIAGLVQDDVRQVLNGAPGLSKLPVLGTLFRSRDFLRNESELVIIVTPYLVRPVARDALARPDDNLTPSNDKAGYFLGKVNRIYGSAETSPAPGSYHGVVGYIYK